MNRHDLIPIIMIGIAGGVLGGSVGLGIATIFGFSTRTGLIVGTVGGILLLVVAAIRGVGGLIPIAGQIVIFGVIGGVLGAIVALIFGWQFGRGITIGVMVVELLYSLLYLIIPIIVGPTEASTEG